MRPRKTEPEYRHGDGEGAPLVEVESARIAFPDVQAHRSLVGREPDAAAALRHPEPARPEPVAPLAHGEEGVEREVHRRPARRRALRWRGGEEAAAFIPQNPRRNPKRGPKAREDPTETSARLHLADQPPQQAELL